MRPEGPGRTQPVPPPSSPLLPPSLGVGQTTEERTAPISIPLPTDPCPSKPIQECPGEPGGLLRRETEEGGCREGGTNSSFFLSQSFRVPGPLLGCGPHRAAFPSPKLEAHSPRWQIPKGGRGEKAAALPLLLHLRPNRKRCQCLPRSGVNERSGGEQLQDGKLGLFLVEV